MVDEHNEKYDEDEGEYHFSDDQINYEIEPDAGKVPSSPSPSKTSLKKMLDNNRRLIIGTGVGIVLIFVLYKMLSPTTETVSTELKPLPSQARPVAKPVSPLPVAMAPAAPIPAPATAVPGVSPQTMPMTPPQPAAPVPPAPASQVVLPPQQPTATTVKVTNAPTASPEVSVDQKSIIDKLVALEEENSKLSNMLQTQFVQKMADYEAQNNATQERVQMLNKRLANMEASLTKMAQLLQNSAPPPPKTVVPVPVEAAVIPVIKPVEPKMIFTVQAIIPGRAWLKSDTGETITVAEGDMLREYGRVVKIDPYDGVVDIDTGKRIITLSYGAGGD